MHADRHGFKNGAEYRKVLDCGSLLPLWVAVLRTLGRCFKTGKISSVFICVHPWLKLKSTRASACGSQQVEHQRVIWKQGNGMADAGAQPPQPCAREL